MQHCAKPLLDLHSGYLEGADARSIAKGSYNVTVLWARCPMHGQLLIEIISEGGEQAEQVIVLVS